MFNKGYGHVGRPTNAEVSNKKKKRIIIISLVFVFVVGISIFLCFMFNNGSFDLTSIMGNSATNKAVKVVNVSLNKYSSGTLYLNKNETYYIFCNNGKTSKVLTEKLNIQGYRTVNIIGGYFNYLLRK